MQHRSAFLLAFPIAATVLVACAKGAVLSADGGGEGAAAGAAGSTTGGTGGGGGGSTTSTTDTGVTTSSSSSSTTSSGSGGSGGAGGGGGSGGSVDCFDSPNACPTAEALPDVSGDEGGTATASGTTSKWFKVHVQETDSSIFASDLSYSVTLSSPAGMDYDLYVRQGPEDGNPDCGAAEKKGSPSGGGEMVSDSWNDDQGLGGEDDSLWLCIEVRYVSGSSCNAQWSLTVVGNP